MAPTECGGSSAPLTTLCCQKDRLEGAGRKANTSSETKRMVLFIRCHGLIIFQTYSEFD
uniref:Uncharacterized protein n=1 Tax=Arundo donax TaxID=35708 RepID=A0A0A8YKD6_ARUDO